MTRCCIESNLVIVAWPLTPRIGSCVPMAHPLRFPAAWLKPSAMIRSSRAFRRRTRPPSWTRICVAERAYELYLSRGGTDGLDQDDWFDRRAGVDQQQEVRQVSLNDRRGCARIGCSGWEYKHWRGDFYPADLPRTRWFEHYAATFDTVEINNTFYRLPERATFAAWAARAPPRFVVRGEGKPVPDAHEEAEGSRRAARPAVHADAPARPASRAACSTSCRPGGRSTRRGWSTSCRLCRNGVRHVVEFRDPSWYARRGSWRCWSGRGGAVPARHARARPRTRARRPVRLRALPRRRREVRRRLLATTGCGVGRLAATTSATRAADVYAYFNNDVGGHAPRDALTLRRLLGEQR